jgi:uncharacterized protein
VCLYLATFFLLRTFVPFPQWVGFLSAIVATAGVIGLIEHGHWPLGFDAFARRGWFESLVGLASGVVLIGIADTLLRLFVIAPRIRGDGFPWMELASVYVPAAVHEELLFRGYIYQKIRTAGRVWAIAITSLLFAGLHAGNTGLTAMALANIAIGGVLLALAYEWRRRLWMPIGLHFAWNLMSGPILGYAVSGYLSEQSLFITHAVGPEILAGGAFGLEGTLFITAAELIGIVALLRLNRKRV